MTPLKFDAKAKKDIDDTNDYIWYISDKIKSTDLKTVLNMNRMLILIWIVKDCRDEKPLLTISELSRITQIPYKEVVRHLKILEKAKLIERDDKTGKDKKNHPVYIKLVKNDLFDYEYLKK